MLRTFETHAIRKQVELSGKTWDFEPLDGEQKGRHLSVCVPSCWETYPGFENYRGRGIYRTQFQAYGNIRLEFKGVSHFGKVFVDGKEVVSHYNSYTPFDVVVKNLKDGIHQLAVEVDNSYREEYSLDKDNDYMSYGGISRGVVLEQLDTVYISQIHVTPLAEAMGGWHARVQLTVRNVGEATEEGNVKLLFQNQAILEEGIQIPSDQEIELEKDIFFQGVNAWTPEMPTLYLIHGVFEKNGHPIDDLTERIGFRIISVDDGRICLNGRPLRIKGVCRHEDHPQYGCAIPLEAMAYDLGLIRDLGANSVRTVHYPNDERFLDLCDEMGILVWEENHARGLSEERMRNPHFEFQAEQVIREMITAHYNHPSIYIWGILNECASETEYGRTCYDKQYQVIRQLDSSRPCSSATCRYENDLCLDLPDVVSWNMYPYWYENKTAAQMVDELYQWSMGEGRGAGKPFLITEVGAGAIYGFRSPEHDKWTEEYQAEALEYQLTEIMDYKPCTGLYIWQFCDNRVGKGYFDKRPRTRNNKGIVDEFRRRKLAYDIVKRLYGSCPGYWE